MNLRPLLLLLPCVPLLAAIAACGAHDAVPRPLAYVRCDDYDGPRMSGRDLVAEQGASMRFQENLPRSVRDSWAGGVVDTVHGVRRFYVTTATAKRTLDAALRSEPDLHATSCLVAHTRTELQRTASLLVHRLDDHGLAFTILDTDEAHNRLVLGIPANASVFNAHARTLQRGASASDFRENADEVGKVVDHLVAKTRIEIVKRKATTPEIATAS